MPRTSYLSIKDTGGRKSDGFPGHAGLGSRDRVFRARATGDGLINARR